MDRIVTGTIYREIVEVPQYKYVGWVPTAQDRTAIGDPAVIPGMNQDGFNFTEDMQWLSYNLAVWANPLITKDLWEIVYKYDIAFTNGQGFLMPGDPRRNYVKNINQGYPEPKLMKSIICAWNFYRGEVVGDKLRMTPGVHAIDGTKPMPDISTVVKNNWYFEAVNNDAHHSPFNQGQGGRVLIPFILKWENDYPLELFAEYNGNELPQVSI